ncbi:hypothetical protein Tco_0773061 [Tanacetum coccineum]|uniref:Uncharacterized protein n=1 Tax=Tanacetum coccineum TaxID=301880 RepID=A0ABQ4ZKI9_9ASTR
MAPQKYSVNQEKNDLTMSVLMKNRMKHLNESLVMPQMMNLKKNLKLNHLKKNNLMKNDRQNVSQQAAEQVISVKGMPWVGDGGVSGVSLFVVSSADDRNSEVTGNGGIDPQMDQALSHMQVSDQRQPNQFDMTNIHLSGAQWVVSTTHPDRDNLSQ